MIEDTERAVEIEEQINDKVTNILTKNNKLTSEEIHQISNDILDKFVINKAPELEDTNRLEFITMSSIGGRGGATSKKKGNLTLNFKKLVVFVSKAIPTVVGSVVSPILLILGAIAIWDDFWSLTQIAISEKHASVLWTMWINRDPTTNLIEEKNIYPFLIIELEKYKIPIIEETELPSILNELRRLKCIEPARNATNRSFWLREWVKTSYN